MVRGCLIGSVRALRVMLQSKAHVEGNLFHQSLLLNRARTLKASRVPRTIRYPAQKFTQQNRSKTTTGLNAETARTSERLHTDHCRVAQRLGTFLFS